MSESLRIAFPYSADDHAAAIEDVRSWRIARRVVYGGSVLTTLMGVGAIAIVVAFADKPFMEVFRSIAPLFVFPAAWIAALSLLRRYHRWSLRRKRSRTDEMELRVFSDDGFLGSSTWAQPVPWFLVDRVVETPKHFLVYATTEEPSYVPKSAMQPVEVERLRELIATHAKRAGTTVSRRG